MKNEEGGESKRAKAKSRQVRWQEASADALGALDDVESTLEAFERKADVLDEIRQECAGLLDNLPERQSSSSTAEMLETVANFDLEAARDSLRSAYDEARATFEEAEAAEIPRGFGRD